MDAVSYSLASKQAQRIEKFIENPDSMSGIVTVPKTIASGETITIPAGRVAVLPNVQVDGTMNILGEVFIPSGATFGDLEAQLALKASIAYVDGKMVLGTSVNSTSGTAIDFTNIPSWVKKVKIIFKSVSTNGTALPLIQLGDSGGIETTGYESSSFGGVTGSVVTATSYNTGIVCTAFGNAGYLISGQVELIKFSGNIWISSGNLSQFGLSPASSSSAGYKELSGTLDRIRITTTNGTDTFDAGSINIMYEG